MFFRKTKLTEAQKVFRDKLELIGEDVLINKLANLYPRDYIDSFIFELERSHAQELAWLLEKRKIATQKEKNIHRLEKAILIFVTLGVIVETLALFHAPNLHIKWWEYGISSAVMIITIIL